MSKEVHYLKKGFEELGISPKTIEKDLEVSQSFVSNILNGKKAIGGSIAVRLHELYGLELYWLLTGKGDKLKNNKKVIPQDNVENNENESVSCLFENTLKEHSRDLNELKFQLKILSSISSKAFELLFENFDIETLDTEAIENEVRKEFNSGQ
ncbi:helix-turn-helix transcriptional regulator [Chryseobacterium arthrosphaerae]|uniref:helix-turn-helix transcriptional regulator n=1 Tax=Chryseobacterium arthrosphaerae TaxID=651561 RepID=UPI0031D66EC9